MVMAMALAVVDDLENVSCPICLDVYEKPCKISCGHRFCSKCVDKYAGLAEPTCPMCRAVFNPSQRAEDKSFKKELSKLKGKCFGCAKVMPVTKLRSHHSKCPKTKSDLKFQPVAKTSQPAPSPQPNRMTFKCPFCGVSNFDVMGLVKHCNNKHRNSTSKVVCPICASMPWGDPSLKSSNFISHLNMRHKFEYDTFVDYSLDDETMLQAAIKASLEEQ